MKLRRQKQVIRCIGGGQHHYTKMVVHGWVTCHCCGRLQKGGASLSKNGVLSQNPKQQVNLLGAALSGTTWCVRRVEEVQEWELDLTIRPFTREREHFRQNSYLGGRNMVLELVGGLITGKREARRTSAGT